MKKSKNGFTLIELLMTIIIISVVAFIATSAIQFSVKDSRRKSKENEDAVLKDAVEMHVSLNQMEHSGYTNLDELCIENSLAYNSQCSEVTWCKIKLADLVDSGAIQSFPSNVLNEDGSKAYDKDTSFAYVQFINGNLVPSSISIDPDSLDNTCPNGSSSGTTTPDEDTSTTTNISEFVTNYSLNDSLIAFYDGEHNQKTTTVHSSNTSTWYDLVGSNDLSLSVDSDSKPVWKDQCLNFGASSTDYIKAAIDLYSEEIEANGFTIYSVFSNSGYNSSITNYAYGLTDSDNTLILANGWAYTTSKLKFTYEVPGAVLAYNGTWSSDITITDKKIVSAFVVSPASTNTTSGYPKAQIMLYIDNVLEYDNTSVGSLHTMITQSDSTTDKPISNLHIGGIEGLTAKDYDTCIYNFLIYKKALSADEIQQLYTLDSARFGS